MYYLVRLKRKKPKILHESEREKEREREGWRERRGGREEKEEGGEEKKKDRIVTRFILFEPQEWGGGSSVSPQPSGRSGGRLPPVTLCHPGNTDPTCGNSITTEKRARGRSPRLEAAPPRSVGSDGHPGRWSEPLSRGTWGTAGLLRSRPWG